MKRNGVITHFRQLCCIMLLCVWASGCGESTQNASMPSQTAPQIIESDVTKSNVCQVFLQAEIDDFGNFDNAMRAKGFSDYSIGSYECTDVESDDYLTFYYINVYGKCEVTDKYGNKLYGNYKAKGRVSVSIDEYLNDNEVIIGNLKYKIFSAKVTSIKIE